jgi:hypothetical protein
VNKSHPNWVEKRVTKSEIRCWMMSVNGGYISIFDCERMLVRVTTPFSPRSSTSLP